MILLLFLAGTAALTGVAIAVHRHLVARRAALEMADAFALTATVDQPIDVTETIGRVVPYVRPQKVVDVVNDAEWECGAGYTPDEIAEQARFYAQRAAVESSS